MGGAISLKTYNRHPEFFSGVVFIAPMCKLSDKMLPPDWVINLVQRLLGKSGDVNWLGELPVAPAKGDTASLSFKLKDKKHLFIYGRKPRLEHSCECLDLTSEISKHLAKRFDAPFSYPTRQVGRPAESFRRRFYDESPSKDKEIKIYDGMWHNLLGGEPIENIDLIFNDSIRDIG